MKNLVLFVAVLFAITTLNGCGKKQEEDPMAMEGLNGVVSENVVSVDQGVADGVPVYVENAEAVAPQIVGEMAAAADSAVASAVASVKPTSKQIQQALKNAGIYTGKVDGDVGPRTKKAIEEFQAKNGLKVDGKVGAKTWRALAGYLSQAVEVENPTAAVQMGQ